MSGLPESPQRNLVSHPARAGGSALDAAGVWAAMSHEIRTPLMGVVGMLEILARTSLSDEQRRIIATANVSSVALMRIVDDVLDLAKLESARFALAPVATDLVELIEGCTELLANQAEGKGLAVTCEAGFDVPMVLCDALRLRQVLLNLGINAVKFTDSGHVALAVCVIGRAEDAVTLRFTIADTGIGIPPELHAFLFQPFSQLALAAGRGLGGVGLGLAICRSLIEAMGGKISVDSAPGRGTRFSIDVDLPLAAQNTASPPRLDDVSVVAVDAGEPALQIALAYLEAAGARVRRVAPLSAMSGSSLAYHLGTSPDSLENLIVVIGPEAEAEDVQAATASLDAGAQRGKLPVLWLHPRAVGGAAALARRGVRAVRAHPLRRAALLAAVTNARSLSDAADAPVLTRRLVPMKSGDEDAAATARAEGRVVLIAEDNIVNQQVLRQQLAILGFDCDIAGDGNAALQALRSNAYLLLLCDCHMPGMDGFELTRLIRAAELPNKPRLPIIAITANAMPGEADRCRAAGMDDYLAKPIEISGLQAMLERWLEADWHPISLGAARAPAPALHAIAADGTIDLKNLRALFGDDHTRLKPVLEQWRSVIEDSAVTLRAALAAKRWSEAEHAVHRIKGNAGIAGAHGLSAAAATLELALGGGDAAAVAKESGTVLEYIAAALVEVNAWHARTGADTRAADTQAKASQAALSATDRSLASR